MKQPEYERPEGRAAEEAVGAAVDEAVELGTTLVTMVVLDCEDVSEEREREEEEGEAEEELLVVDVSVSLGVVDDDSEVVLEMVMLDSEDT